MWNSVRAEAAGCSSKILMVFAETDEQSSANPTPSADREPPNGSPEGWVAERLKAHDWKSCGLTPSWVRIPPHPLVDVPRDLLGQQESGRGSVR
jgi:hypothetical protein